MHKLTQVWNRLRSTLWFLPSLIVTFSILLAALFIEIKFWVDLPWLSDFPLLLDAGAEGARAMLSTIASSMMSVIGVTFSMTLVALALASTQYSSRILRNFMRSQLTQIVLGTFAGIFTYCLIVLRTIRSGEEGSFVPHLAVFFGFIMALAGVGILIFFIHHIASSIQVSNILGYIAKETVETVRRNFPEKATEQFPEKKSSLTAGTYQWQSVLASHTGYIQSVDYGTLTTLAKKNNTLIRIDRGIGRFVVREGDLVSIALLSSPDQESAAVLRGAFTISRYRTMDQDPGFGIRQIVDVALKALSAGINDTTTAVTCVDYLTAILIEIAGREIPLLMHDEDGVPRVITGSNDFEVLVTASFDQIRENASGNTAIILTMLEGIRMIAERAQDSRQIKFLQEQAKAVVEMAGRTVHSPYSRAKIEKTLGSVRGSLKIPSLTLG